MRTGRSSGKQRSSTDSGSSRDEESECASTSTKPKTPDIVSESNSYAKNFTAGPQPPWPYVEVALTKASVMASSRQPPFIVSTLNGLRLSKFLADSSEDFMRWNRILTSRPRKNFGMFEFWLWRSSGRVDDLRADRYSTYLISRCCCPRYLTRTTLLEAHDQQQEQTATNGKKYLQCSRPRPTPGIIKNKILTYPLPFK